jgi:hypothetical protein
MRPGIFALMLCMGFSAAMSSHSQNVQAVSQRTTIDFPQKVTNLKVLPGDMSHTRLRKLMRGYEADLGVSCSYCHVEDRDTGVIDYASDENTRKLTARVMISMVETINEEYLAKLGGDTRYSTPVTCGSCHQGHSSPLAFEAR